MGRKGEDLPQRNGPPFQWDQSCRADCRFSRLPIVDAVTLIATIIVAYFMGSIPTGFLFGKARGLDIRTIGSGNIGATNVFRALGKKAGCLVLLLDALKGWIGCVLVPIAVTAMNPQVENQGVMGDIYSLSGGLAAILGHNYTCWLRFKGGKGVATSAGVLFGLVPVAFGVVVGLWCLLFVLFRYVSLASVAAAFVLPFSVWLLGYSRPLILVCTIMAVMAIYKHRTNLKRLMEGTEHRFGSKKVNQ